MPKIARIQMPDGRVAKFEVPDDYTPEQAQAEGEKILSQPSLTDIAPEEFAAAHASGTTANFLKGLGQGLGNLGVGIGQRFGRYTPQDVERRRIEFAPVGATGAGGAGEFIGQTAPGVAASFAAPIGGPLANTLTQGLIGMMQGAAQPTGPDENWLTNAFYQGIGGAAGGLGSSILSRAITPIPGVPKERIALAKQAAAAGYPTSVGQITGSPFIKKLEGLAGGQPEQEAAKQAALNRIATRSIGVPTAENLSAPVLQSAYAANAAARQNLVQGSVLNTTQPDYLNAVRGIINDYNLLTPTNQRAIPRAEDFINDLVSWARQGSINGDVYQANRSALSRLARQEGPGQHFYSQIIDAMDAAAPRTTEWAVVNNQYKTLKQLDRPGIIDANGDIKGGALWALTQGQRGMNAANPLREAATYAKAFPPQPAGANMTPGIGAAFQFAGTNALTGAAGGSIGSYYYGARDPAEIAHAALLGAGMGFLSPRLIQAAGNNPILRRYLMRGAGGMDFTPFLTRMSPFAAQGEQRLQEQRALEAQQNQ